MYFLVSVSCGDPGVPANGQRLGNSFLYRDVVSFVCDDGFYQSSGLQNGTRECLINGQWSETQPVCSGTLPSFFLDELLSCEWVACARIFASSLH